MGVVVDVEDVLVVLDVVVVGSIRFVVEVVNGSLPQLESKFDSKPHSNVSVLLVVLVVELVVVVVVDVVVVVVVGFVVVLLLDVVVVVSDVEVVVSQLEFEPESKDDVPLVSLKLSSESPQKSLPSSPKKPKSPKSSP